MLLALVACDEAPPRGYCYCVGDAQFDALPVCNPLSNAGCATGEKCAWIIDATMPQYLGHTGCVPDGMAPIGAACEFGGAGATGYDNCQHGGVCSAYQVPGTAGVCESVCDPQGGPPTCDATHACAMEPDLFWTGVTSPPAAGVCVPACDPLADNDFDGSGSAFSRTGTTCGSADVGCYGIPSGGTAPRTSFMCMPDLHYGAPLVHRTECTTATGCAASDGTIYVNSCNQGYLPVFRESTAVSTAVCIAMCKPLDCYAGNCGSNNVNRLGAAPHRCAGSDALGAFGSGEECQYMWAQELDGNLRWLPSPYSDSVGFCFDHSKYEYDASGDGIPDTTIPGCEDLPLHGSGSGLDAVMVGCVSSQTAGLTAGSAAYVHSPLAGWRR